jgi:hypothetical protein
VSGPPGPPKLGHTHSVTEEPGGNFIVGPLNAKDRWSVVAITVGLTAACAALVIWGGLLGLIGGLPGLVFFGLLCLPVILFRAVHPEPELVVSADGFTVNQSATDMGFISWDEVESIGTSSLGGHSWVTVQLRDPDAFLRRHSAVRRVLMRLRGTGRSTVRISGVILPRPVSEVAAIMEAKRRGNS